MTIDPKSLLQHLFERAIAVADPMQCIASHLPPPPKGRLVVVGAGKASARMAEAVEQNYETALEGLVITRYGYARPTEHIEVVEAAHPVPDQAGVNATRRMLNLVSNLTPDDMVLALISGGGSALLCAPIDGMTLEQKQQINKKLLQSGAPISAMNAIRQHFSAVKGGKLAAACTPAQVHGLIISDVPGDDPEIIASGPTVPPSKPLSDIQALAAKWHLDIEPSLIELASKTKRPAFANTSILNQVVAAPSQSLTAAKQAAKRQGCDVVLLGDDLEGEARSLGKTHARMVLERSKTRRASEPPLLILSGGECTVTKSGDGIGGPNAEYALAALIALEGAQNIALLAADTDGVDGAAEVAGAFVLPDSWQRAGAQKLDPTAYLSRNDAHSFFAALGDQLITGPTLTNVNDFRAFLIW
ncbi:glycerate kinase type-2 family protein [Maritalea mediterranea]|uniref:Glycerate kinase n=1 Tax=Maritalea mediterranea TaxID=2909667 RepID=A0ABS9E620_9HYPH|nr:glycerate kinase [Maritalea mediterranea]MCF4098318.1 glycerate kinase [Maritalea mediterranea]